MLKTFWFRSGVGFCAIASLFPFLSRHGISADKTPIPYQVYNSPSLAHSEVFRNEMYNHAATVARFGNQIYVAWNGNLFNPNESSPGQVILVSQSGDNGKSWSAPIVPFQNQYRALDLKLGPSTEYGNATNEFRVRQSQSLEWQPSLVTFNNQLLMFWNQDRGGMAGSTIPTAFMMSILDTASGQWRSHEMHFGKGGAPYMAPVLNAQVSGDAQVDPTTLTIQSQMAQAYPAIHGAANIPLQLNIKDLAQPYLNQQSLTQLDLPPVMPLSLVGWQLFPQANQATILKDKSGNDVLSLAMILVQTKPDFNNSAIKIPALLTTRDLQSWNLSIVPLKTGPSDFLKSPRGDVGLIAPWEPTITQNADGSVQMLFRINYPPQSSSSPELSSPGYRMASALGTDSGGFVINWATPNLIDLDVPITRGMMTQLKGGERWVMAHNHNVQGLSYSSDGVPQFLNEQTYTTWPRMNLSLFFSTQGPLGFVSGLNISSYIEKPNFELVHYPSIVDDLNTKGNEELLVAFSTHRRLNGSVKNCTWDGDPSDCSDSIQFVQVNSLPSGDSLKIYPNHFANTFAYSAKSPQDGSYSYSNGTLLLKNRASAGIETKGDTGCVNLKLKMNSDLAADDSRPVLSFGRSSDRTKINGLRIVKYGTTYGLVLGDQRLPGDFAANTWVQTQVCYDFLHATLSSGGVTYPMSETFNRRSYLGDPTLAPRKTPLPDLAFDVSAMSLD